MNATESSINFDGADVMKKCVVCKKNFCEITNTAKLECWQHYGDIKDGMTTCCQTKTITESFEDFYKNRNPPRHMLGCVRCDHRTVVEPFGPHNGIFEVPMSLRQQIQCSNDAVMIIERTIDAALFQKNTERKLRIHRYDITTQSNLQIINAQRDTLKRKSMCGDDMYFKPLCKIKRRYKQ